MNLKEEIEAIIRQEINQSTDGSLWGEDAAADKIIELYEQQQQAQQPEGKPEVGFNYSKCERCGGYMKPMGINKRMCLWCGNSWNNI